MPRSYKNSDPALPIMQGIPVPPEWRVPPHDWDNPPWNRWSFQHVRELIPTVNVPCGPKPWHLPGTPIDAADVPFTNTRDLDTTFGKMLDDTYTDATLIWHDGRVLVESYFNAMTSATPHIIYSVSKSVTSAVTGILIGDGLMDPAEPITNYLPELDDTAWKGATLQHVLDMASGVKFDETYGDQSAEVFMLDVAACMKPIYPWMNPDTVPGSVWDLVLTLKDFEAPHGSRFEYRSIETDVLGFAMERATGKRLHELVALHLWGPMGAEHDGFFSVDREGFAMAYGGFNATLRDLARFGRLLLEDGARGGTQIIPRAWINDIRGGDHGHFNDYGREFLPNGRYRNKFWIIDATRPAHLSLGIFGQHIFVDPETGTVAVKLSSWPDFVSEENWTMDWVAGVRAVVAEHGG